MPATCPPTPEEVLSCDMHFAVTTGHDQGLSFPAEDGLLGRCSGMSNPKVSAEHLRVTRKRRGAKAVIEVEDLASSNGSRKTWGRVALWHVKAHKPWTLRVGRGLRVADQCLQLRRRPVDTTILAPKALRPGFPRALFFVLPLFITLPFLFMYASRFLYFLVPLLVVGIAVFLYTRRHRAFDAASLLLAACSHTHLCKEQEGLRAWVGQVPRVFKGHGVVEVQGREKVAFVGADAVATARWWVAQLLVRGVVRVDERSLKALGAQVLGVGAHGVGGVAGEGEGHNPPRLTILHATEISDGKAPMTATLVIAQSSAQVPPWCVRQVFLPTHAPRPQAVWWKQLVEAVRRRDSQDNAEDNQSSTTPDPLQNELPDSARCSHVLGTPDCARILEQWNSAPKGLSARIGVDAQGSVREVDLCVEGPHALIAGTTGAGKSELLTTWLMDLACRYSPAALTMILVDYKGGAAFGVLRDLPHCAGVLTDLDPAMTHRALDSLKVELRRRKKILASLGAKDIGHVMNDRSAVELNLGKPLSRLLVVVDEFRALSMSNPQVLDTIVDIASQGRSLGIHVILATQRPSGIVSAQISANVNLRLALRTRSELDSMDVIDSPLAARLAHIPGRLLLRSEELESWQVPWAGDGTWTRDLVENLQNTWALSRGGAQAPCPWAAPLPTTVQACDLLGEGIKGSSTAVLGLADDTEAAQLRTLTWDDTVPLNIAGSSGQERSTLAAAIAQQYADQCAIQVVTPFPDIFTTYLCPPSALFPGSLIEVSSLRLVNRLMAKLKHNEMGKSLVIFDDVPRICEDLGIDYGTVHSLVSALQALSIPVILTASKARAFGFAGTQIFLGHTCTQELLMTGITARPTTPRFTQLETIQGRGVVVEDDTLLDAQFITPEEAKTYPASAPTQVVRDPQKPTQQISPIPSGYLSLGIGGDDARPIVLNPEEHWVVIDSPDAPDRALDWLVSCYEALGYLRSSLIAEKTNVAHQDRGKNIVCLDTSDIVHPLAQEALTTANRGDTGRRNHEATLIVSCSLFEAQAAYSGDLLKALSKFRILASLGNTKDAINVMSRFSTVDLLGYVDPVPRPKGQMLLLQSGIPTCLHAPNSN
ncbi:MAG: FtsK/SpoIIIE domain-containing protein [Actinomycetaceae bacterium]|nr:FtsK/SpoIIIE domain-containing protein [Actinomycetaceae bacterium]